MTERSYSADFDATLRAFLAWQSEAVAGAPTAADMKRRLGLRAGSGQRVHARHVPRLRLLWIVAILALVTTLALAASAYFGQALPNPLVSAPSGSPITQPSPGAEPPAYLSGTITVSNGRGDLNVLDVASGVELGLVHCDSSCTGLTSPAWSPDGRSLAYIMTPPTNSTGVMSPGIWVRDVAAGTSRLVLGCPDIAACELDGPMAWSPDGRRLAFFRGLDLAYLTLADGEVTVVKHHDTPFDPQLTLDVSWTPDGQSLSYVMNHARGVIGVDGTNDRALSDLGNVIVGGTSPDGTRVAYVTDAASLVGSPPATPTGDPYAAQLWVANVDGSSPRVVAQLPNCCIGAWVGQAAWSADGQELAWAGWNAQAQRTDVVIASGDGSASRFLGASVGEMRPAWYPIAGPIGPQPSATAAATQTGSISPSGCAPVDRVAQNSNAMDLDSGAASGPAPTGAPANGVVAVASLGVNDIDSYVSVTPWQGGAQTVLMAVRSEDGRSYPNHRTWSPDGRRLAFSVADGVESDGQGFAASAFSCEDLFVSSADGSSLYRLTHSATNHGATSPAHE